MEPCPILTERLGQRVTLKLECLQVTGSFKIRGAAFCVARLTEAERRSGVATCSAGNHGKALAHAARSAGIRCRIHVPRGVDEAKLAGIRRLGADVVVAPSDGYDETEIEARRDASARGLPFVSAFEGEEILAGNGGTLAREIMEDAPDTRWIAVPVSGGGLAAGLVTYLTERAPAVRVVACQHRESASLARSLERGEAALALPPIQTLAGGLEGGIGGENFTILRDRIERVATAREDQLWAATRWMLDTHQILIEPSAAVTVAVCLNGEVGALEGPGVVVLSGRNVGLESVRTILGADTGSRGGLKVG
jgi:threonine dehydratase